MVGLLGTVLGELTDRLIQWGKERRDQSKNYFVQRVQPLFSAVESAHENYARTFADYAQLVINHAEPDGCPQLFQKIEYDMMLTSALRTKVRQLRIAAREPEVQELRTRVGSYVRSVAGAHRLDGYENAPRLALLAELEGVLRPGERREPDAAKRDYQRAGRIIVRRLRHLDEKYGAVFAEYERLRARLAL